MPISLDSASLARAQVSGGLGAEPQPAAQKPEANRFHGELVRAERTQLSGTEAARALSHAWEQSMGEAPSDDTLSVLVAQWAHETGRGASMLNYNFGGIKGTSPSGLSASYATREGWGDSAVRTVDRFRAYGSAEEGAADYVRLLQRRYPAAIEAAERGDAASFVRALKAGGYFTDNEASYVKSVSALAEQALARGFDAVGAGGGAQAAGAAAPGELGSAGLGAPRPALAHTQASPAHPEPSLARAEPPANGVGLSVAELGAFVDEVNRAALLSSALRIAQTEPRRS